MDTISIRPLNDVIILEMEDDYLMVDNPEIVRIVKEGNIILPEKNSLQKVAEWGNVIHAGIKCVYPFKRGDRVRIEYNLYHSSPQWYIENGKKYRIVKESMLDLVEE